MVIEPGYVLTLLIFATCSASFFLFAYGLEKRRHEYLSAAESALYLSLSLSIFAMLLLTYYFVTDNFSIAYVYSNSDRNMPLLFKISAVWAGKEGSLLLWSMLTLAVTTVFVTRSNRSEREAKTAMVLTLVSSFVTGMTFAFSNPFSVLPFKPYDGVGMNPLLRTFEMVLHPPVVFLAYSLIAVPYAMILAGYGVNSSRVRLWVKSGWFTLTLGIVLGCWWAYRTLGWGGFWGWDPVENSSLLPWLSLTAYHHAKGRSKNYFIHLAFLFVIFAAFMTRSGIVKSVHAFASEFTGWSFILFFATFAALSVHSLKNEGKKAEKAEDKNDETPASTKRYYATLLFSLSILSVFIGTFTSIFFSIDRGYYQFTFTPIFALIVALIILEMSRMTRIRARFLLHLGVIILFVGALAVWNFENRFEGVNLNPSAEVGEWTLKLKNVTSSEDAEKFTITATIGLTDDVSGLLHPKLYVYKIERNQRVVSGVDVLTTPLKDYYLALREVKSRTSAVVDFYTVPLINLVWLSFALMLASSLALFGRQR